jgi:hypothetical protein
MQVRTVVFLEGVYYPELIDSQVCRKGRKVQADEGPKAFIAGTGDEEMKAIFFRGAEGAWSITLRITVEQSIYFIKKVMAQ